MGEDGVGEEGLTVYVPSMERVGLLACYLYRTGSLGEDGVGEEGLTVHLGQHAGVAQPRHPA